MKKIILFFYFSYTHTLTVHTHTLTHTHTNTHTPLYWIPELRRRQMVAMATIFARSSECVSVQAHPPLPPDRPQICPRAAEREGKHVCCTGGGGGTGGDRRLASTGGPGAAGGDERGASWVFQLSPHRSRDADVRNHSDQKV